ncbi:S9 family peptidase [Aquirufa echingensis]|uniref:S9 family peptidase n=1 Tax=Aquirufa echingensis TaxID=3096516 RepID=A0ABW6CWK1_9BACT
MKKILLFVLLVMGHATLAQKPAMSHESMWMLKKIGTPAISPSGKWVVYSRTETSYITEEQTTDLWLAATDGSAEPRKITNSKGGEENYFWHPSANQIFFTAKREGDEVAQLYRLNLDLGGEAQRLTSLSPGISTPKISSDGRLIAFTSRVFATAFTDSTSKKLAEEKKKIKTKARVYTSFPIRYWDSWLDEKQSHIYVMDLSVEKPNPVNVFSKIGLVESKGFQLGSFAFSPDASQIVFTATTEYNTTAYQSANSHLYAVSISGGTEKLLSQDPTDYSSLQFSEDGKYLIAAGHLNGNKIYYSEHLYRFTWPSMEARTEIATGLDRPINDWEVSGNSIFASIEDQGVDRAIQISIEKGGYAYLIGGDAGSVTGLSVAGNTIAYTYQHLAAPAEVYVWNAGKSIPISEANDASLAKLDLPKPEVFWTKSSRGKMIRSVILRPAGFDASKKYPLFVLMHGGPAISFKDAFNFRWNPYVIGSTQYVIVMTDYTGSVGYGEKFAQDIQFDPFKGPGNEILEAAADAIKRYSFIDASRQAAGGASYGGHLANWMQATTSHFKCLIAHAGLVNSEAQWGTSDVIWGRELMNGGAPWVPTKTWKEQNPMRFAANFKTPMLLTVGENDFRVPINNTLENWSIHQRLQIPSKLIVFPGENHWILNPDNSKFHYQEVRNWLGEYLK